MFGCGTAALIAPIKEFTYKDKAYNVPIQEEEGSGPLA